jgi:hypothetical protein
MDDSVGATGCEAAQRAAIAWNIIEYFGTCLRNPWTASSSLPALIPSHLFRHEFSESHLQV